jgi:hypothetical protein
LKSYNRAVRFATNLRGSRLLGSILLAVGVLALTPAGGARPTASLSLFVSFFANGTVTVTLPDGTAIGTTSGTPTLIPAGFYTIVFSGPGGCTALPYFHLTGPGTNIATNMAEGAAQRSTNTANLLPSSTYTWISDAFPNVVHTFTTSAVVEGSPPSGGETPTSTAGKGKGVTYPDLVGSEIVPFRGTLTASVSPSGRLSLAYKGKGLTSLKAGKYTIAVTDRSANAGLVLQKLKRAPVSVTGSGFMGTRSVHVQLTAGRWLFAGGRGEPSYTIAVS